LKWGKGGKECHKSCKARLKTELNERLETLKTEQDNKSSSEIDPLDKALLISQLNSQKEEVDKGLSTGATIGLAIGGVALLGTLAFVLTRK
jgi:hypothetical protein